MAPLEIDLPPVHSKTATRVYDAAEAMLAGNNACLLRLMADRRFLRTVAPRAMRTLVRLVAPREPDLAAQLVERLLQVRASDTLLLSELADSAEVWSVPRAARQLLVAAQPLPTNTRDHVYDRSGIFSLMASVLSDQQTQDALERLVSRMKICPDQPWLVASAFNVCVDFVNNGGPGYSIQQKQDRAACLMRSLEGVGVDLEMPIVATCPDLGFFAANYLADRGPAISLLDLACMYTPTPAPKEVLVHGLLSAGADYERVLAHRPQDASWLKPLVAAHPRVRAESLAGIAQDVRPDQTREILANKRKF